MHPLSCAGFGDRIHELMVAASRCAEGELAQQSMDLSDGTHMGAIALHDRG